MKMKREREEKLFSLLCEKFQLYTQQLMRTKRENEKAKFSTKQQHRKQGQTQEKELWTLRLDYSLKLSPSSDKRITIILL